MPDSPVKRMNAAYHSFQLARSQEPDMAYCSPEFYAELRACCYLTPAGMPIHFNAAEVLVDEALKGDEIRFEGKK